MQKLLSSKRNNKGYSLAELLIVIAILGIVLSAISVGVSAAMRQYQSAMRRERVNLLYSALYERICSEFRYGTAFKGAGMDAGGGGVPAPGGGGPADADPTDDDSVDEIIYSSTGINRVGSLFTQDSNDGTGRSFIVFKSVPDNNGKQIEQPLVSESSYFSSLSAEIKSLKYDSEKNVFTIKLAVKDTQLGEEYIKEHEFMVSPLNKDQK